MRGNSNIAIRSWPSNEAGVHVAATVMVAAAGLVVEAGKEVGEVLAAGARVVGVVDAVSAVDTAGVGVLSLGLMFTDWNDIGITLTIF